MFKFDVYLRCMKLSIAIDYKTSINCVTGFYIIHATMSTQKQSKIINGLCRMVLDAVCTHVTLSATLRYDAVKLTTDIHGLIYQF